jgi:transcriptional regulator NrdR family protein
MNCQTCGEPVNDVVDVRKNPENVWRRRKCRKCGATWSTVEAANPSDVAINTFLQMLTTAAIDIDQVFRQLKAMKSRGGAG